MLLSIFLKPPELKDKNQVDFITDDEISWRLSGLREKKTSFSNTSFGKTLTGTIFSKIEFFAAAEIRDMNYSV